MEKQQVLVIGGGFAGIEAVRAIRRKAPEAAVTLIDANEQAVMVPALPDVVSGRIPVDALARPLREILDEEVTLHVDLIREIDLAAREVRGEAGSYRYDYLVLANGSRPEYFGFKSEGGTLHTVHSYPGALAFRRTIEEKARTNGKPEVIVVGGGYTGLEVAASLRYGAARSGVEPRIRVVELADDVLTFLPEKKRQKIKAYLASREIELLTGTSLKALKGDTAHLSNGETVENATVCWSAGMRAAQDTVRGDVERAKDGRFVTDENLRLPGYPEVWVAGDAAELQKAGTTVRRAVNFAFFSGRRAGENVAAVINGKAPRPFAPTDLGWVIPLSEMSHGKIFGFIRVGGKLGLRLHYFMCGFRHFGPAERWEFYKTALNLRRNPGSLEV